MKKAISKKVIDIILHLYDSNELTFKEIMAKYGISQIDLFNLVQIQR